MNPLLAEVGWKSYSKWLWAFWTMTAFTALGLFTAIPHIDGHPVRYAFGISWILSVVVAGVTRDKLLQSDPKHFQFAWWECEGLIYHWVGVEAFCWFLKHTPLGWLNPSLRLTPRKSEIEALVRQMGFAEGAHLIGGVITLGLAVAYAVIGHATVSLSFGLMTVFFHAIPVMVQRWNRGRIARLVKRVALSHTKTQNANLSPEASAVGAIRSAARSTSQVGDGSLHGR
jgi:hypothetical protein